MNMNSRLHHVTDVKECNVTQLGGFFETCSLHFEPPSPSILTMRGK